MIDLELGSGAVVARVHVLDDVGPLGLGVDGLSLGAGRVPCCGLVLLADEATGGNTSIGASCGEDVGVSSKHDVLFLLVVFDQRK